MSELVTNSVAQEQQEQRIGTRTAVERLLGFTMVAAAVAVLAVLVATAIYAQDKVLAEIAERNRVLRLQGVRGLGRRLLRPNRRSAHTAVKAKDYIFHPYEKR